MSVCLYSCTSYSNLKRNLIHDQMIGPTATCDRFATPIVSLLIHTCHLRIKLIVHALLSSTLLTNKIFDDALISSDFLPVCFLVFPVCQFLYYLVLLYTCMSVVFFGICACAYKDSNQLCPCCFVANGIAMSNNLWSLYINLCFITVTLFAYEIGVLYQGHEFYTRCNTQMQFCENSVHSYITADKEILPSIIILDRKKQL
ncbi:hypothetical protein ACJX0J_008990 [Zea mays]